MKTEKNWKTDKVTDRDIELIMLIIIELNLKPMTHRDSNYKQKA